tara:strand:+ start:469 stop:1104 length:636 start_codon:yes stop_codon:yes gene_type:complete
MVSDDGLLIKVIGLWLPYLTLLLSFILYSKYKQYGFYKYFIIYILTIIIFDILSRYFFTINNITLFNVYTFFEFNSFALIYYHLINDRRRLKVLKALVIVFNAIYFISFYFDFYILYTIPLEGVINSVFVILFFIELLNSERILNYKKLLSFWISVGFLIFYLTTVPFWSLYYSSIFDSRAMFPIIYYLATVFQLIFIYGLVTCKKTENLY